MIRRFASTACRFLSNVWVYPVAVIEPSPVHVDRGERCVCGHDAIDHTDRTAWCEGCTCSYWEPIATTWSEFDPAAAREQYEQFMATSTQGEAA